MECAPTWREFCPDYLHMSSSQADRIIKLYEDFGPSYFELSQLTRVSPETYRAIEPAIKAGAIHHDGEVIVLDPDNSRKVAATVSKIRKAAAAAPPTMKKRIQVLDGHCRSLLTEVAAIASEISGTGSDDFMLILQYMEANMRSHIEQHDW